MPLEDIDWTGCIVAADQLCTVKVRQVPHRSRHLGKCGERLED